MPCRLVAQNISLTASGNKKILNDASLVAFPGELTCIMGPSGSGKTSLLNIIAGRTRNAIVPPGSLPDQVDNTKHPLPSGNIYVNGKPVDYAQLRSISKYVMQTDCLLPFLSVEETLHFAAKLKLSNMDSAQRAERVENTIRMLNLDPCRKTLIGNNIQKGVSSGQKKRVSIAIELLDDPELIYLDEPTSGLDSSLAYDVLKILKKASAHKTVIATVHQPRQQILSLMDRVIFLSLSRVVYQGPCCELREYWESVGHPVPRGFNVADFSLDLLTVRLADAPKKGASRQLSSILSKIGIGGSFAVENIETLSRRDAASEAVVAGLPDLFEMSRWGEAVRLEIQAELANPHDSVTVLNAKGQRARRALYNSATLIHREILNRMRNRQAVAVPIMTAILFGLFSGSIYYKVRQPEVDSDCSAFFNVLGVVAFSAINQSFQTFQSWVNLPERRPMFNRERASGMYQVGEYVVSLVVGDLPFSVIPPLVHTLTLYWLAGLGSSPQDFFFYLLMCVIMAWAGSGWCLLAASISRNPQICAAVAPLGITISMLLSGLWVTDNAIPRIWTPFKYLSWMRYGINGYFRLRFDDINVVDYCSGIPKRPSPWGNIACSFAIGLAYRMLSVFGFAFTNTRLGLES